MPPIDHDLAAPSLAPAHERRPAPRLRFLGAGLLSLITFLWGTTFIVQKYAVGEGQLRPSALTLGRFLLAALCFAPFLRRDRRLWIASLELGLYLWLGYATQTIGLQYTNVARSAFITSLHVIFVPLLALAARHRVRVVIWPAALMAFSGAGLMSSEGTWPNLGDLWTVGTALAWALYIFRLETHAARFRPLALTGAQMLVVSALSLAWMLFDAAVTPTPAADLTTRLLGTPLTPALWLTIVYLGLFTTALTTILQVVGQRLVTAPQTAILFTLEPVWAILIGYLIHRETLGLQGLTGATLILTASLLAQAPWESSEARADR